MASFAQRYMYEPIAILDARWTPKSSLTGITFWAVAALWTLSLVRSALEGADRYTIAADPLRFSTPHFVAIEIILGSIWYYGFHLKRQSKPQPDSSTPPTNAPVLAAKVGSPEQPPEGWKDRVDYALLDKIEDSLMWYFGLVKSDFEYFLLEMERLWPDDLFPPHKAAFQKIYQDVASGKIRRFGRPGIDAFTAVLRETLVDDEINPDEVRERVRDIREGRGRILDLSRRVCPPKKI